MRILLEAPNPDSPTFEVDHQIQKAIVALHDSQVGIRGAGRFGGEAAIILKRNEDRARAVDALSRAGIQSSVIAEKAKRFLSSNEAESRKDAGDVHPARSFEWPTFQRKWRRNLLQMLIGGPSDTFHRTQFRI
jgi:hypothetical protein